MQNQDYFYTYLDGVLYVRAMNASETAKLNINLHGQLHNHS